MERRRGEPAIVEEAVLDLQRHRPEPHRLQPRPDRRLEAAGDLGRVPVEDHPVLACQPLLKELHPWRQQAERRFQQDPYPAPGQILARTR